MFRLTTKILILLSVASISAGCSSRKSPTIIQDGNTSQFDDLGNDPFDSTGVPPATTTPGTNANLFDTTTGSDRLPIGGTTGNITTTGLTSADQACLTQDSGLVPDDGTGGAYYFRSASSGSTGTSISGTNPLACYNSNGQQYLGPESFFNAGISSFGLMSQCYQQVAAYAPQAGWSQAQVQQHFVGARMAMVRCYREIEQQQLAFANWSQPQKQAYQQTDNTMFVLLTLFAQDGQQGGGGF